MAYLFIILGLITTLVYSLQTKSPENLKVIIIYTGLAAIAYAIKERK